MSHWGRRLWRWSAALFALLVILLATLVGLVRLASPLVPKYRAEVEAWASAAIHHPVQISAMGAEWGWHGPEVTLEDVRILSPDRARVVVSAQEVQLGVGMWGLLQGKLPLPDRIVLVAPQLEIHRDAAGVFSIAGLEGAVQNGPTDWHASLREVFSQSAVLVLKDGRITYVEAGAPRPMLFQAVDLQLDNAADSHILAGDAELPPEFGRSLAFKFTVRGEGIDAQQWDWRAQVDGRGLQLPRLLHYWKPYDGYASRGVADLDASLSMQQGALQKFSVDLNATDLTPAPKTPAAAMAGAFASLSGDISWSRNDQGWTLTGRRVQLARGTQVWPRSDFTLDYAPDANGATWSGAAGFLRLQDLTALSAWLPAEQFKDLPRLYAFAPTGDVSNAAFKLRMNASSLGNWAVRGTFLGLGVHKAEGWPGFSGMTGKLDLNQTGGSLSLAAEDAGVDFTPLFRWPLHADSLQLSAKFAHNPGGWQVSTGAFSVANPDAAAHGSAAMQFPADGSAPRLDLDAVVDRGDARNKSLYFPVGIMPKDVVQWLDGSIKGGQVASGSVSIHGKTADFPFDKGGGVFDIQFHLVHGELDYADGWPAIKDLDADVRFLDQGLQAKARSGKVAGQDLAAASADFADLSTGVLKVDGIAKGDATYALAFLRSKPLRQFIGGYLDGLEAVGPTETNLHLVLPVENLNTFQLNGTTYLRGVSFEPKGVPGVALQHLQGALSFNKDGIATRGVDGTFLGGPVHIIIQPGKGKQSGTAEFAAEGSVSAGALMDAFKPMPTNWLEGTAQWRLEGRVPNAPATSTAGFSVNLHSDLQGMAVKLPAPFSKQAGDVLPLNFGLRLQDENTLACAANYGDGIQAKLDFARNGDAWSLGRGNLHLGAGAAQLPANPGLTLTGTLDQLSWDDWKPFMPASPATAVTPAAEAPPASFAPLPAEVQGVDLTVGNLRAYDQSLDKLHLSMTRTSTGWQAQLDSAAAAGSLTLPASVDADHPLVLNMDRLLLTRPPAPKAAPAPAAATASAPGVAAAPAPRYDPRRIPALRFSGKRLEYGELKLGGASFSLKPLQDGVALEDIKVDSDSFSISGDATWTVTPAGLQHSSLNMDVKSHDVGKTLQDLGFAPAITGSKGEITADLNWQDSPLGEVAATLGGTLHVKLEDGQIVDVQPGAGRVFGLLSLNALPRRLLLNFSDVFAKGFGYDSIEGDFTLQDGDAYTQDLQVKGPAAKITLIGRTGIAKRDFDEALIVDPSVGATLPVVAGLAAGLVPGAVVLLLTEIFKKPISAAGQTRYHLTGTWDNPVLTKQGSPPATKPSP